MVRNRVWRYLMAGAVIWFAAPPKAQAVPGYARNLNMECNSCHSVYPQLNAFGKEFKEALGESLEKTKIGKMSVSEDPFSVLIKLRPIDKRWSRNRTGDLSASDKQLKVRSYHESEVFVAGRTGPAYFFTEFEAEDEWPDGGRPGFDVRLAQGYAAFQVKPEFNIFLGYTSPFAYDANNTVNHANILRRQWSAASFVPGVTQMIGVAGRIEQFTYIATFHGDEDDTEGHDPENFSLRGAFDVGDHTVGAYATIGTRYDSESGESTGDYKLYGVDARLNFGDTNIMALVGIRDVDGADKDDNFSVEFNHTFDDWTALANVDTFTRDDGSARWTQGAFGLIYWLNPNMRIQGTFEGTLDAPAEYVHKEKRFSINADLGF